ncbi:hypothetical protein ACH4TE_24065 [Streptomyces sioyaensis]|uniref:hypothetical protein n=1 Tax=Streptomyces sioyaensis TaxID=67364 RepID=UPI00378F8823
MDELSEEEGSRPGDRENTTGPVSDDEGRRRAGSAGVGEPPSEPAANADEERQSSRGEEEVAGSAPAPDGGDPQEPDSSSEPPTMDMARLGAIAATVITVLAALGGLILGIRAEIRATNDERRAVNEEARAVNDEKEASARDKSVYARHVDFYQSMSSLTVINGSTRVMDMRLVLKNPDVWWDLQALRPCHQFDIPTGLLKSAMSAKEPSVAKHLTDQDVSRLQLELRDPNGRVWRRDSGGLVAQVGDWNQPPKGLRVVSSEPWNLRPEKSPYCGD